MTMKEMLKVHREIERENARKLLKWKRREAFKRDIRRLNEQIAEEALKELKEMGVIA